MTLSTDYEKYPAAVQEALTMLREEGVGGPYAIALGPYTAADAPAVLRDLLARGLVPRDSFIVDGAPYTAQVFPIGAAALAAAQPAVTNDTPPQTQAAAPQIIAAAPEPAPEPEPELEPEETLQEARRNEAQLDRPARDALQIALQWFGFYTARIDGAFGPGTYGALVAYARDTAGERQLSTVAGAYGVLDSLLA